MELLLPTLRSWARGGCKSQNSQLLWLPRSLSSPTLEGHRVAVSKCITFILEFPFWLAHSTGILTRSKEMCQPFPWALPSLLSYKNSYFPFGSGRSLVPNIMQKRFLIKYDLAWSILLLKSLTLLYAQALIKHQIIIKNKISNLLKTPPHFRCFLWFDLLGVLLVGLFSNSWSKSRYVPPVPPHQWQLTFSISICTYLAWAEVINWKNEQSFYLSTHKFTKCQYCFVWGSFGTPLLWEIFTSGLLRRWELEFIWSLSRQGVQ